MNRRSLVVILIVLILGGLVVGCGESATTTTAGTEVTNSTMTTEDKTATTGGGQEIVLKAITAWPENVKDNAGFFALQEKVNAAGKGKVRIEYLGGPEVVPTEEQPNALKAGTVDIAWLSAGYTTSLDPIANAVKLSTMSAQEERESGVTDLWNKSFGEKLNARLLARGSAPNIQFHIYSVQPIRTLADFKGVSLRTTAAYLDFVTALGASPVNVAPGEVYSALERGVVDGYGWVSYGIADMGWDELTKYVIDPGFYQVDPVGMINLGSWNKLPADVQDIINQAAIETEAEMGSHFTQIAKDDRAQITKDGIEVVTLSDSEAKTYVDLAYKAVWDKVLEEAPTQGAEIKTALGQ